MTAILRGIVAILYVPLLVIMGGAAAVALALSQAAGRLGDAIDRQNHRLAEFARDELDRAEQTCKAMMAEREQ